jgi:hypothetical protein
MPEGDQQHGRATVSVPVRALPFRAEMKTVSFFLFQNSKGIVHSR